MLTIYLVRHGETDYNKKGLCQGQIDIPLNETGLKSATLLGKKLKENNIKIDYYYSSPLKRAYETVINIERELGDEKAIFLDKRFIERNFASLEGKDVELVRKIVSNKDETLKIKDYEKDEDVGKRFYDGIKEMSALYSDKTILIGSHSHSIKCFLMYLDSTNYNILTKLKNMNVTKIIVENNNIKIDKFSMFN